MKVDILGVKVDKVNLSQALQKVEDFLTDNKKHYIVTPNSEIVVAAQKDAKLLKILNSADLSIPDGIGLVWASKILSSWKKQKIIKLTERVTGIDLMEKICQLSLKRGLKVGLLGARGEISQKAAKVLQNKLPKLRLVVLKENYPIKNKLDILFVAMGAPKQERWIWENLAKIPVLIAMGVGGAFEMIAGIQKRAPKVIQNLGLEWLWRLILQPWRIKRQLALLKFAWLVFHKL